MSVSMYHLSVAQAGVVSSRSLNARNPGLLGSLTETLLCG